MMEDIKREHDELLKKKVIVEKDKCKILQSIEVRGHGSHTCCFVFKFLSDTKWKCLPQELDKKKAEALEKTHAQVNKDFGNIFSTLLPGTQVKYWSSSLLVSKHVRLTHTRLFDSDTLRRS